MSENNLLEHCDLTLKSARCVPYSLGVCDSGRFLDDFRHGDGVMKFADGSEYNGRFINGIS